jgi:hypothetical protein
MRENQIREAEELLFGGPQKLGVAKGLFQGKFIADWVTPYPKLPEVESLPAITKFLDENLDPAAIDRRNGQSAFYNEAPFNRPPFAATPLRSTH